MISTPVFVTAGAGDLNPPTAPARERWSWALYDFANTIFSMNIGTLYFAAWMVTDLGASNTMLAVGTAITSALVMLSIPVMGAISDATQRRKPFIVWFTILACVGTALIGVVGQTVVPRVGEFVKGGAAAGSYVISGMPLFLILVAYILASYTYQAAMPFYNAMLPDLVPAKDRGRLSGIGAALGYVGSITGVLLVAPFVDGRLPLVGALPDGLQNTLERIPFAGGGGQVSTFVPTALLFLVFSLPLFFYCRDHNVLKGRKANIRQAFSDVRQTLRDTKKYPGAGRFILASFLYQDALGTIIGGMALFAIYGMGFSASSKQTLFIVLTVPAVLGSYLIGRLVDRIGPKRSLMFVISAWIVLLVAMIFVPNRTSFWIVGAMIGLIFGGVATAERPLLLTLIPDVEAGRFFSLMVLSSRAAAIVGPFIWAFAVDGLSPMYGKGIGYRAGVATVALAMAASLLILRKVPDLHPASARRA